MHAYVGEQVSDHLLPAGGRDPRAPRRPREARSRSVAPAPGHGRPSPRPTALESTGSCWSEPSIQSRQQEQVLDQLTHASSCGLDLFHHVGLDLPRRGGTSAEGSAYPRINGNGVRSSWAAFATNWRSRAADATLASKETSILASVLLRARPSCPTSEVASPTSTRCERSPAAIKPAVAIRSSKGHTPRLSRSERTRTTTAGTSTHVTPTTFRTVSFTSPRGAASASSSPLGIDRISTQWRRFAALGASRVTIHPVWSATSRAMRGAKSGRGQPGRRSRRVRDLHAAIACEDRERGRALEEEGGGIGQRVVTSREVEPTSVARVESTQATV